ncbi:unnamed protein product [Pylaiella littoralis]
MIFNYLGIIEEILTRKSAANSRAKDVSVPDVVNVYAKAPFKSVPSHTTVREYLRICSVISTEALKALRSMEEQGLHGYRACPTRSCGPFFVRNRSSDSVSVVCHGTLPAGIPADTTPQRINSQIRSIMDETGETGRTPTEAVLLIACKNIASTLGWEIKENTQGLPSLHAAGGKSYDKKTCDIPLWGKPIIFDTRQDALNSLNPGSNEMDLQYVRLVLVADYQLLQRMCLPGGKEAVRSKEAGLYIKVAADCPAYRAIWELPSHNRTTSHEVASYLERNAARQTLLDTFNDAAGGKAAPACLLLREGIDGANNKEGVEVTVSPGVSVVREGWCDSGAADTSSTTPGGIVDEDPEMDGGLSGSDISPYEAGSE